MCLVVGLLGEGVPFEILGVLASAVAISQYVLQSQRTVIQGVDLQTATQEQTVVSWEEEPHTTLQTARNLPPQREGGGGGWS